MEISSYFIYDFEVPKICQGLFLSCTLNSSFGRHSLRGVEKTKTTWFI